MPLRNEIVKYSALAEGHSRPGFTSSQGTDHPQLGSTGCTAQRGLRTVCPPHRPSSSGPLVDFQNENPPRAAHPPREGLPLPKPLKLKTPWGTTPTGMGSGGFRLHRSLTDAFESQPLGFTESGWSILPLRLQGKPNPLPLREEPAHPEPETSSVDLGARLINSVFNIISQLN